MANPTLNPIQRFQASKHRRILEEFLNSETGQALLLTLPHFCPSPSATLNPQIHGANATINDVRADSCAQIIGFERCSKGLLALCQQLPQTKPQLPEPDYQSDPFSGKKPEKE
jgi:hypothetical protein